MRRTRWDSAAGAVPSAEPPADGWIIPAAFLLLRNGWCLPVTL